MSKPRAPKTSGKGAASASSKQVAKPAKPGLGKRTSDRADSADPGSSASSAMSAVRPGQAATSQPFWAARTGSGLHPDLLAYSETIAEDAPFVRHDCAGSIAHVAGLHKSGLLIKAEATQLIQGLQAIPAAWSSGRFRLDRDQEDLHMNIETRLTAELGDTGKRLHSGRSRNDQVATCIVLYAREGLAQLAANAQAMSDALASRAKEHAKTPWTSRTHGQAAQPATLGYLLAGHAHRLQDLAEKALQSFERVGESPLGSGAVAGSTLPLRPDHTAKLMGLRAPRSALLATGTRDTVYEACSTSAHAGLLLASLSEDLLDLFTAGGIKLPDGYTTGSSLMPHKRNPDALELARGRGKSLHAPLAAVTGILGGMGLGYQRDFQLTKPYLVAALHDANSSLALLTPLVQGFTTNTKALSADWSKPGVVATDVAEALVKAGLPFRTAYQAVAKAFAEVEKGAAFADALAQQSFTKPQLEAALAALVPDPGRRATVGGPAPQRVMESLAAHSARGKPLAAGVKSALAAAATPFKLLTASPQSILES